MANEIKRFYWGSQSAPVASANIEGGTFTLTFDSQTTIEIDFDASASTIQTELEALSSVGSGNCTVTAETNGFTVEFTGSLANTDVGALTFGEGSLPLKQKADTISVNTVTSGDPGVSEQHAISLGGATTGTFTLTNGFASPEVSTLDTAGIQAAYDSMYGPGGATVYDIGGGDFQAFFNNAGTQSDASVSGNSTDGSPSVSVIVQGEQPEYQVVTVILSDNPTEGSLNVTLDSSTSADFYTWDPTPAAISGWTAGGTAGNWSYTRDIAATDVSASGAEGMTPLRKSVSGEIVTTQEGSGGGYTMNVSAGSYSLSGQSVGLTVQRTLEIGSGSYTLAGQSVALARGYSISLETGSYLLAGQDVGLAAQRTLTIETGSYLLTGQDFGLNKGFTISIGAGSYTLTGNDVELLAHRTLALGQGSYSLTGQDLTLQKGFTITLDSGAYALTGQPVELTAHRTIGLDAGSYALAGQDVSLSRGYVAAMGHGSYVLAGQDVGLLASRVLVAETGAYVLSGQDVELGVFGGITATGLEYTATAHRLHYTAAEQMHFTANGRLHFAATE